MNNIKASDTRIKNYIDELQRPFWFERGGMFVYRVVKTLEEDKPAAETILICNIIEYRNISPVPDKEYKAEKLPIFRLMYYTIKGFSFGEFHTHPNGNAKLSDKDILTLKEKRKWYKSFLLMIITESKIAIY